MPAAVGLPGLRESGGAGIMTDLRTTIRAAIERLGISQAEAARRAGMSPQALCDYLRGRGEIRTDTLERILAALRLRVRGSR